MYFNAFIVTLVFAIAPVVALIWQKTRPQLAKYAALPVFFYTGVLISALAALFIATVVAGFVQCSGLRCNVGTLINTWSIACGVGAIAVLLITVMRRKKIVHAAEGSRFWRTILIFLAVVLYITLRFSFFGGQTPF